MSTMRVSRQRRRSAWSEVVIGSVSGLFMISALNCGVITGLGGASPTPAPSSPTPSPTSTPSVTPALVAGRVHSCYLDSNGGMRCWGQNGYNQVGTGNIATGAIASVPSRVMGLDHGVVKMALGDYFTCVITFYGGVRCFGDGGLGQGGDGTSASVHYAPSDVSGLSSGVTQIAAGQYHACAITSDGGVKCWGYNFYGQLGDSTATTRTTPVSVSGLTSGVTSISAGSRHTCALTSAGGVKCWGYNFYGQLGDASTTDRSTPVDVSGLTSGVAAISAHGYNTCALLSTGGVKCWGNNPVGEVGDSTSGNTRSTPVDVTGLTSGVASIVAGGNSTTGGHTCAITTSGGAKCWGYNGLGQVGDNSTTNRTSAVNVSGLTSGVSSITLGENYTCAILTAGNVKCWGYGYEGQLGNGSRDYQTVPVDTYL